MAGVFLSYSSQDRERVELLAEALRAEGFEVWWDREIPVAFTYEEYIREQLDRAGAVVVAWSPESVASQYVRWEAQRARQRGVLVPVLLEPADLPPEYFLVQSADLTRWEGSQRDREWRRLVAALVRTLGEPPRPPLADQAALPPAVSTDKEPTPVPVTAVEETVLTTPESPPSADRPVPPVVGEAAEPAPAPAPATTPTPTVRARQATGTSQLWAGPWYRKPAVLAGAAVAALAAAMVPIVLSLQDGGGPATTAAVSTTAAPATTVTALPSTSEAPTTSSTAAATTTATTTTTFAPETGLVWARTSAAEVPGAVANEGEDVLFPTVAFGSLFVSVGSIEGPPPQQLQALVTLFSQGHWEKLPDSAVFGGPGTQAMADVAVSPGGVLVAVGIDGSGGDADAAVWTSRDAITWERVPHDEAVFGGPGDQEMWAVAVGGPGLVAVGSDDSDGDMDAAVWVSSTGQTWQRLPDDQAILGGPGFQMMQGVVAGGPGMVAVGHENTADGDGRAVVWVSQDGWTWERIPHDEAIFGDPGGNVGTYQDMVAIAAAGSRLVAVGSDRSGGDSDGAVWISADGLTWERIADNEEAFGGPGDQGLDSVMVGGPGLLARLWDSPSGSYLLLVSPPPG
jgi:hypothetical protein